MPIRAQCTICSDFLDQHSDVAAIHCGHTFHHLCLEQWFTSAPSRTCPQCRIQVSKRQIIQKLFFDVGLEEDTTLDPESLKNEVDKIKANLHEKEKEKRKCQDLVDSLREMLEIRNVTIEALQRKVEELEMLSSSLKRQMKFFDLQQSETKAAKDEARRLRNKLQQLESIEVLLQSQRPEVEAMIRDMGSGAAAVEQLAVYCVSLKKEYDKLKEARKSFTEMMEKLKKELFSSSSKAQKAELERARTRDELIASQKELENADREIMSLKKKVEFLQKTLSTPTATNEAISRLIYESPAPIGLQRPKLRPPMLGDDINLDLSFDIRTPEQCTQKNAVAPCKKIKLDKSEPPGSPLQDSKGLTNFAGKVSSATDEEEDLQLPSFIKNSLLHKKPIRSLASSWPNTGVVRTGFDGLGGRTKFIQTSSVAEIRPLPPKIKRKKVSRPAAPSAATSHQPRLEDFLK
ncbi:E3 ubiquitin-protein ligase TRAIP isoform X2 [Bufo bufo]|uniref:E3 ubiquitin-protein ligase TRAIP isoform X2 n=1 Tax=Bufo bufo TaxID=8384 RepID=UPI001ABE5F64|nr:E3 ubiquitin-protein ligase TRAIP isoform X2 [Bufo bufo]